MFCTFFTVLCIEIESYEEKHRYFRFRFCMQEYNLLSFIHQNKANLILIIPIRMIIRQYTHTIVFP